MYLHSGNFDSGNIDIAILDKAGNLYGVKSIGLGSPENIQRSFEKFINSFTRKTLLKEPEKPAENKDMNKNFKHICISVRAQENIHKKAL